MNRPALEAAHGYDTKYAMHMLRLGHQGVELLETGRVALPMAEPARQHIRDVREGRVPLDAVLAETGQLERRIKDLLSTSPLPEQPDTAAVEAWMVETYMAAWQATRARDAAAPPPRCSYHGTAYLPTWCGLCREIVSAQAVLQPRVPAREPQP